MLFSLFEFERNHNSVLTPILTVLQITIEFQSAVRSLPKLKLSSNTTLVFSLLTPKKHCIFQWLPYSTPLPYNPVRKTNSKFYNRVQIKMGQNVSRTQRRRLCPRDKSKDELLYEAAVRGDNETVRILHREGASLEWRDHESRTPLIVACSTQGLYSTADTLIELGANIDASSPGFFCGTPLHHAARRGNIDIVKLLLSRGANALLMNDNNMSAAGTARASKQLNVVHTIERHICKFSGWMKELRGPGFLDAVAPKLRLKKIWVVVLPCPTNSSSPFLELLIYNKSSDLYPRSAILLWKATINKPKFQRSYYALKIVDKPTGIHYRIAPAVDCDKQQIQSFYTACVGKHQTILPVVRDNQTPMDWTVRTEEEATELAMALSASVQSTPAGRASFPFSVDFTAKSEEAAELSLAVSASMQSASEQYHRTTLPLDNHQALKAINTDPSAPPIPEDLDDGLLHYPTIDMRPVSMPNPVLYAKGGESNVREGGFSLCTICWDSPVEGAFFPCGHMVGCISCLNEIRLRKGVCPICWEETERVMQLYAV